MLWYAYKEFKEYSLKLGLNRAHCICEIMLHKRGYVSSGKEKKGLCREILHKRTLSYHSKPTFIMQLTPVGRMES